MHKAIAKTEFTHNRQYVREGESVYVSAGDVAIMERRGLIELGSAEEVDDLDDEAVELAFQQRQRDERAARAALAIEGSAQADGEKNAPQHENKMLTPPENKGAASAALKKIAASTGKK